MTSGFNSQSHNESEMTILELVSSWNKDGLLADLPGICHQLGLPNYDHGSPLRDYRFSLIKQRTKGNG